MSLRVRQNRRHLVTIRDVERFDERVDAFGAEAGGPFEFVLERTQAYVNWRYADPRAGDFAIKLAEEEGQMVGYAVLRKTNGRAQLADMMALPGRDDVVQTLTIAALEHFREAGEPTVQFLMPKNHAYEQTLRSCGFAGKRKRKIPPSFLPMRLSKDERTPSPSRICVFISCSAIPTRSRDIPALPLRSVAATVSPGWQT